MEKEFIYLTDITLHTRDFRPTTQYSKVAEKGRMYFPMKSKTPQKPDDQSAIRDIDEVNHTLRLRITFPPDLQERIDRGEVEVMIPEDGLNVFAGKDTIETAKAMAKKGRRVDIHKQFGKKGWIDRQEGV